MAQDAPQKSSTLAVGLLVVAIVGIVFLLALASYRLLDFNSGTSVPIAVMPEAPLLIEVNDPSVQFFYIDYKRGMRSAKSFTAIPPESRAAVAVLTPAVANSDKYFVADFMETSPGGHETAQPMSPSDFQDLANVVAKASFLGADASLASTFVAIEIKESKLRKKKRRKKKKKQNQADSYRLEKLLPVLIPLL